MQKIELNFEKKMEINFKLERKSSFSSGKEFAQGRIANDENFAFL